MGGPNTFPYLFHEKKPGHLNNKLNIQLVVYQIELCLQSNVKISDLTSAHLRDVYCMYHGNMPQIFRCPFKDVI